MPYRQEDLVRRALTQLGEVGNGQDLAPEDAERVRFSVPAILAELYERGIYAFPCDGDVPAAAFEGLSVIVASALSSDFGLPQDEIVTLASRAQAAEAKLRVMRAQPYVNTPTRVDYF